MNRKQWRELRVFYNNHDYLPESHFWYTSLMRRQNTICSTRDRLSSMSPSWRIGSRVKPNGGWLQKVLPVSPIFIDTCHWCQDDTAEYLFEGYMYCRDCAREAIRRMNNLQERRRQDVRLKIVLLSLYTHLL